jgi:CRP/FNR family transcriptional regulator, cyclic AMP receptor protein
MSEADLSRELAAAEFLHGLPAECLRQLASLARRVDIPPGGLVFREGDPANEAYLVVEGNVALDVCAPGVGCRRLMTVGPGELLGWSPLLVQSLFTATARALEPTRTLALDGPRLRALCEGDPRLGYEIMRRTAQALARRLSATRMQLLDVFAADVPELAEGTA